MKSRYDRSGGGSANIPFVVTFAFILVACSNSQSQPAKGKHGEQETVAAIKPAEQQEQQQQQQQKHKGASHTQSAKSDADAAERESIKAGIKHCTSGANNEILKMRKLDFCCNTTAHNTHTYTLKHIKAYSSCVLKFAKDNQHEERQKNFLAYAEGFCDLCQHDDIFHVKGNKTLMRTMNSTLARVFLETPCHFLQNPKLTQGNEGASHVLDDCLHKDSLSDAAESFYCSGEKHAKANEEHLRDFAKCVDRHQKYKASTHQDDINDFIKAVNTLCAKRPHADPHDDMKKPLKQTSMRMPLKCYIAGDIVLRNAKEELACGPRHASHAVHKTPKS